MLDRRTEFQPESAASGPPLVSPTMVGVFTLILSFFIVLASFSIVDRPKVRVVLYGIAAQFGANAPERSPGAHLDDGGEPGSDDFVPEIERLAAAALPAARVDNVSAGRSVRVAAPVDALFAASGNADEIRLSREGQALLTDIARVVAPEGGGLRAEIDIVAGRGREADQPVAIARGVAVIDALARRGVPREALSLSLGAGERVALVLSTRGGQSSPTEDRP